MHQVQRQLTLRAICTGFILGSLLAPCNIYTGLKIGFSFNMSIAAALLSYAFWNSLHHFGKGQFWGLLENNINQTAASSAASILSAGLVAPIPALTLITGHELSYPILVTWVFTVSFAGVITALAIRRQMLDREKLPFPNGIATAETIKEIYATGAEAAYRIKLLLWAGVVSGGIKLFDSFVTKIPSIGLPRSFGFQAPANVAARGIESVSWRSLGLELQPSLLLFGFGAIVGPRVGISLLLGTILAWVYLPGKLLALDWAEPAMGGISWYETMLEWLLWPGVSLMASAALMSFAISMCRMAWRKAAGRSTALPEEPDEVHYAPGGMWYFPRSWFLVGLVVAFIASVIAQTTIFSIPLWLGTLAFLLSFVLAIVAGRVSGETGIPPIGALGKITQVTFGFLAPANTTINLMSANVTGGAAGQCSDLLHDLKTGKLIGANLKSQIIAQMFGILAGSFAGSAAYLVLIPNPQEMLLTPEWPAPAVATWKAVAEVLAQGLDTIPGGAGPAVVASIIIGILLATLESVVPEKVRIFVPSASSVGFAFIIPPFISLAMFCGAMVRVIAEKIRPVWSNKYLIVIAAGLVAGESLAGILSAVASFFR
jgi:putative OPT family oligopeptide transporter